jgi:hypothetical protein
MPVLYCTTCQKLRTELLAAKEELSKFVHANGRKHDCEVSTELRALVLRHQAALKVWEDHVGSHESYCDFLPVRGARSARPVL